MTEVVKAILVHGTRDTNAEWCREGSQFRADLRNALNARGCDIEFSSLNWDGKNTYLSRLDGARNLAKDIIRIRNEFSGKLFLICHSHGGNIARKAIDLTPSSQQPNGVITYGTPFIQFKNREVDLFLFISRIALTAFALVISIIPLYILQYFSKNTIYNSVDRYKI
jgi:hypothetical protein